MAAKPSSRERFRLVAAPGARSAVPRTALRLRRTAGESRRSVAAQPSERRAAQFPPALATTTYRVAARNSACAHLCIFCRRGLFFPEALAHAGSRRAPSGARHCRGHHCASFCIRDCGCGGAQTTAQIRRREEHSATVKARLRTSGDRADWANRVFSSPRASQPCLPAGSPNCRSCSRAPRRGPLGLQADWPRLTGRRGSP